jgi:uncharacterized protein (DUF305 family)
MVIVLFACGLSASAQMVMDSAGTKFMQDMDASMKRMDHDMTSAAMTGDVDHDFAAMMIPHHAGAIDMAKGELAYGKDPAMRRLAAQIIVDQRSEIDVMNLWLKKHAAAETKPQ